VAAENYAENSAGGARIFRLLGHRSGTIILTEAYLIKAAHNEYIWPIVRHGAQTLINFQLQAVSTLRRHCLADITVGRARSLHAASKMWGLHGI
jgi:hypothetical protein